MLTQLRIFIYIKILIVLKLNLKKLTLADLKEDYIEEEELED